MVVVRSQDDKNEGCDTAILASRHYEDRCDEAILIERWWRRLPRTMSLRGVSRGSDLVRILCNGQRELGLCPESAEGWG